jgi:hypothetical protein
MDTAMHAAAVPGAELASLKRPETAAREFADVIAAALAVIAAEVEVTRVAEGT